MTPIAPHITAFLQQRLPLERGASDNTCESYAYAFKLLLEFASRRLKTQPSQLYLEQMDAPMILSFLDHLETTRHNGASSRNTRLAAIKSFMRFVEYRVPSALELVRRVLALPMKRTESRLVSHLTQQEMQAILDAPVPSDWFGIRDRAIGACQGTCRLSHAAKGCLWVACEAIVTTDSRSGLRVTAPIGVQSRVQPDQRAGLRSRAWTYTS